MRFEFVRTLGTGATGVVELHRDMERGGALVALKRLHQDLELSPEQETTLALRVTHRYVCRVYDVHRDGDTVVIAMEYVDGETLRTIIRRSGPLPIEQALQILRQIMDGLEEAHARGVLHCDLKPENVMINREGEVKIMDFGLAMQLPTTVGRQDQAGVAAGTPGYMAPEQAEGRNDKRTDIYMMGGLLYEMTTGQDARKKPWNFPDRVPADLRSVILKCSKKNPARRFQSVAELRSALAEPAGWRPLSSYTGILTAGLLLTIALAVGFAVAARPRSAETAKVPTPQPAAPNAPAAVPPADAGKVLEAGKYFLQNNMVDDAIAKFDEALQIDGNLTEAHFQRGLALVKLKRWDDAIASFKRALPDSASERLTTWEWSSNFAPASAHGLIWVTPNRVLYGERKGKDTALQLIDLEQHRVRRLQIPDDRLRLNDGGFANSNMIVLMAYDLKPQPAASRFTLYILSAADATLLWHIDLDESGSQLPWVGVGPRGLLTFVPGKHTLAFYDERSPKPRWTREDLQFNRGVQPIGLPDTVIINEKTPGGSRYRAVNLADGSDAWPLDLPEVSASVAPVRDDDVVYFLSKDSELVAVAIGGASGRILWRTPSGKNVVSLRSGSGQLYAGTASGDLRMIDTKSGEIVTTSHIDSGALTVDYVGPNLVVASSAAAIHGVAGKQWEYPSRFAVRKIKYIAGIVLARTAEDEITALDGETGTLRWLHNGRLVADGVFTTPAGLFIADESGVKQYSTQKPSTNVTNKQILTEVASALLNKGDLAAASAFIAKIEHEIDPASPQLRLLRARLLLATAKAKSQQPPAQAGADLAAFATASGLTSEVSRPVIADLKSGYDLLWAHAVETILPGSPVRVGRWLLNLGPGNGANMQIVALDPDSGEPAWRQPAQHFVDSVAGTGPLSGRIFYVTGDNSDPTAVRLRQVDIRTGEAGDVARWNRTQPVLFSRMALASGRLLVLTVALNSQSRLAENAVDAFDAVSGRQLWPSQIHESSPLIPMGLFMPQGDGVIYSAGHDIWNVRTADGTVLDHQHENDMIGPNVSHAPVADGPIYYVTTRREISAYDTARKEISNSPRPEVDSPQLIIRNGMLFGTDKGSAYGFDLKSQTKWQLPATETVKILNVQDGDKNLWVLREDNVLVAIDRATGKMLGDQSTLWRPAAYTISGSRFYGFTADGLAYALRIHERK